MKKMQQLCAAFALTACAFGAQAQTTGTTQSTRPMAPPSSASTMPMGAPMNGMIGGISTAEFKRANDEGGRMVAAITPEATPLSKADAKLMMEVAKGGMMQLAVSQAALGKVTSEQARMLAQSEVDEQTGLSAKLKEIASAKGVTLPAEPDPKAQALITKMEGMSGEKLDKFYIRESGVKGHQKLLATMNKVQSRAKDGNLKSVAMATLPVIKLHLQVSQAEVAKK